MTVNIESRYPAITEKELIDFEHNIGRSIPRSYRPFLFAHNGGKPKLADFSYRDERGDTWSETVERFLAVHPWREHAYDTFAYVLETYANRYPADLFPIATVLGGSLLLLGADDGVHAAQVFFWDHDWEAGVDEEEPHYDNCHLVANTFDEFLAMLRDEPVEESR